MAHTKDSLHSFANLPPVVEGQLRAALRVQTYASGEQIFRQDGRPEAAYLVASGRVKVVRVTPEGYESILCVRGPGDYFCPVPLLDDGNHLGTAVAISEVTLFAVERGEFCRLCQISPELLAVVQGDCLSEVRQLLNRLEAFAFRSVRERVAIALLNETRHHLDKHHTGDLHLTQQELAGLVGASRESVSRSLKQLEHEGVVSLRRGRIRICDWQQLERIAAPRSFRTR